MELKPNGAVQTFGIEKRGAWIAAFVLYSTVAAHGQSSKTPIFDRRLNASEKAAPIAPDFIDAIARIEGLYDPMRIDETGITPDFVILPGTASMNNVFADRWHLAHPDANVTYRVKYSAQAWLMTGDEPCEYFDKRRFSFNIVDLTTMSGPDCEKLAALRGDQPDILSRLSVIAVPMSLPAFVAPDAGDRMTSDRFWAIKQARNRTIKARAAFYQPAARRGAESQDRPE